MLFTNEVIQIRGYLTKIIDNGNLLNVAITVQFSDLILIVFLVLVDCNPQSFVRDELSRRGFFTTLRTDRVVQ